MIKVYYRISDKSYTKPKLPGATKQYCFLNFMRAFHQIILPNTESGKAENLTIIADNCKESLEIDLIKLTPWEKVETQLGNAGSLRYALHRAITDKDLGKNDLVYFVEDDYLHHSKAPALLWEGIHLGDYVTLYDHPDKYTSVYDYGEVSKVFRKVNSHWRHTISTCMTFGVKVRTLMEDIEIWDKYTSGEHPQDHMVFLELAKSGRKTAVCIPGAACHTDLTFHGWAKNLWIEEWAIDQLCEHLEGTLSDELQEIRQAVFVNNPKGWERLKMLDALHQMKKPQQE